MNEKKALLEKYLEMPEEELTEMLTIDESKYKEGIFPLLIEAAKSRGLGANRAEIIKNSISTQEEIKQKIVDQPLTSRQRRLFTIFPGLAFWYPLFAPQEWRQRKKEANRCQWVGIRNYLLVGLTCFIGINIFSNTPASSDEILLILMLALMLLGISIYLFFQNKKYQQKHNR